MRITFVYKNHESLGTLYLMSALKSAGHDVALVLGLGNENKRYYSHIAKQILNTKPDLVAFSCVTDNFLHANNIAKKLKENSNLPIIYGGPHTNAVPDLVIKKDWVDFICVGEGEKSLPELVRQLEHDRNDDHSGIPGIRYKKNGRIIGSPFAGFVENLDEIPFPDKESYFQMVPKSFSRFYNIITSRGCPYKCTFCFNWYNRDDYKVSGEKKVFRRRSVHNVIDELTWAKSRWPLKQIFFHDDIFTLDKKWLSPFLDAYKRKINIPFRCITHLNAIDQESAESLSAAGCKEISVGIQSFNEETRKSTLNRDDGSNQQITDKLNMLKDIGLAIDVDHILGLPGESIDDQTQAIEIYNKIRPAKINCLWLVYYPNTRISEIARALGLVSDAETEKMEEGMLSSENSFYMKGTVEHPSIYYGICFILNYLPLLPVKLVNFLVRYRLYKFIKFKTKFFSYDLSQYLIYTINIRKLRSLPFIEKVFSKLIFRINYNLKKYLYA